MKYQRGMSLIIVLLILVPVTILGVTIAASSIMQLELSGGTQDQVTSFNAAQSGLNSAFYLDAKGNNPFSDTMFAANGANTVSIVSWYKTTNNGSYAPLSDMGEIDVTLSKHPSYDKTQKCPKSYAASSYDVIGCDYYELTAIHKNQVLDTQSVLSNFVKAEVIFDNNKTAAEVAP